MPASSALHEFRPRAEYLGLTAVEPTDASSLYSVPDWSNRIPALDGLRGIAILMVFMRHSIFGMETNSKILAPFLTAGQLTWSGVDLFFVLSGFLIGGILLDAKQSPHYFKTFYIRRAYRIFPLYFLVTGLFLFRHLPFHLIPGPLGDYSPLSIPLLAYLTLTQNFWMVPVGWFGISSMAATWSLAVEEQFYLTIPFIIRYCDRRRLLAVLFSVVFGAPFLRVLLQYFRHGDFACYVLMPCRADALCMGVLSAIVVRHPGGWRFLKSNRGWLRSVVILLLAGMVYMTCHKYMQLVPPMNTFGYSWIGLFYASLLLFVVSDSQGILKRALSNRLLMNLGTLAYCGYLIHVPLAIAGRRVFAMVFQVSANTSWFLGGMTGIALTLMIASVSWRFFEKPLLRMGHKHTY
ncbi:MAG: acyltransferase [Acidobacteriota bacterium]|nr:acyltransferase [Acidobacteriota bacterium]